MNNSSSSSNSVVVVVVFVVAVRILHYNIEKRSNGINK